jgi:hypothetical protein
MTAPKRKPLTVAADNQRPFHFEVLPLSQLFIDESYQRPLSNFYRTIIKKFDPALLEVLKVSQRPRDRYAVMDGQTRLAALRQLGVLEETACLVYSNLTPEQEADLFARFGTERRNLSTLDRFKAKVRAGEPGALAINAIADHHGFQIGVGATGRTITAIKALEDVFERDPTMIARMLAIIASAWHYQYREANSNELLRGLAQFLEQSNADDERLIDRLATIDPPALHTRAAQLRQGHGMGGKSPGYMAEAIGVIYRKRS